MKRRDLLKIGAAGSVSFVAGGVGLLTWAPRSHAAHLPITLDVIAGLVPMIDRTNLYMFSYRGASPHGMSSYGEESPHDGEESPHGVAATQFPGPTIICQEGDVLDIVLNNTLATDTSFMVGRTAIDERVAAGGSIRFSVIAPPAGTYLYYDGLNGGVNRVMGLHGALIVMPFGIADQSFHGGPACVRQYKWLLGNVDPRWSRAVQQNGDNFVTDPRLNAGTFVPKYFTINGKSFNQTHNPDTALKGAVGKAALVRMLNAGMAVHSMHFHGNHVEVASINGRDFRDHRKKKDAVSMFPLDTRDVVFPFMAPPDIPPDEFALGLDLAQEPQRYPMHCHTELSQTAGGGSYPHGMHTLIEIGRDPAIESEVTRGAVKL